MEDKELNEFIIRAKKSYYSSKAQNVESTKKDSVDFEYSEGDYLYHNRYVGKTSFSGEEIVTKKGTPVWTMSYVGDVLSSNYNREFLKEALAHNSYSTGLYRGPEVYKNGDYEYVCSYNGYLDLFRGNEEIKYKGETVYRCFYHGCVLK